MNTHTASLVFGITFVLAGLLGFVPNPLVAPHGLFAVNFAHNMVHVMTGAVFLVAALRYPERADAFIKAVGGGYVVVTIAGFLTSGTMLLGMVHINQADRWLHLGLAIVILAAGFALPNRRPAYATSCLRRRMATPVPPAAQPSLLLPRAAGGFFLQGQRDAISNQNPASPVGTPAWHSGFRIMAVADRLDDAAWAFAILSGGCRAKDARVARRDGLSILRLPAVAWAEICISPRRWRSA